MTAARVPPVPHAGHPPPMSRVDACTQAAPNAPRSVHVSRSGHYPVPETRTIQVRTAPPVSQPTRSCHSVPISSDTRIFPFGSFLGTQQVQKPGDRDNGRSRGHMSFLCVPVSPRDFSKPTPGGSNHVRWPPNPSAGTGEPGSGHGVACGCRLSETGATFLSSGTRNRNFQKRNGTTHASGTASQRPRVRVRC